MSDPECRATIRDLIGSICAGKSRAQEIPPAPILVCCRGSRGARKELVEITLICPSLNLFSKIFPPPPNTPQGASSARPGGKAARIALGFMEAACDLRVVWRPEELNRVRSAGGTGEGFGSARTASSENRLRFALFDSSSPFLLCQGRMRSRRPALDLAVRTLQSFGRAL